MPFLNTIFQYAPAAGEIFKTVPGIAVAGTLIWTFIKRTDCRLLPAKQGIGWRDNFGPFGTWPLKVVVKNIGPPVDYARVIFERVEVIDFKGKVIMKRQPRPKPLRPVFEETTEIVIPIEGALRAEQRANRGDVCRLHVVGKLVSKRKFGLRKSRRFDFEMDSIDTYRGEMKQKISG